MLSAWSEWSTCSKDCDGGEQERTRKVESPALGGGRPCEGDLKQVRGICTIRGCAQQEYRQDFVCPRGGAGSAPLKTPQRGIIFRIYFTEYYPRVQRLHVRRRHQLRVGRLGCVVCVQQELRGRQQNAQPHDRAGPAQWRQAVRPQRNERDCAVQPAGLNLGILLFLSAVMSFALSEAVWKYIYISNARFTHALGTNYPSLSPRSAASRKTASSPSGVSGMPVRAPVFVWSELSSPRRVSVSQRFSVWRFADSVIARIFISVVPVSSFFPASLAGNGIRHRARHVVKFPTNLGKPCEGSMKEIEACNVGLCDPSLNAPDPVDCEIGEWSSFGECSATCGGGVQIRIYCWLSRSPTHWSAYTCRHCEYSRQVRFETYESSPHFQKAPEKSSRLQCTGEGAATGT